MNYKTPLVKFWDPETDLKSALVSRTTQQMYPVLRKLHRGEAVTVLVIGSSITADMVRESFRFVL